MSPVLFVAAHPDDETLAMGVAIAEHLAAGQDVHVLWVTRGTASGVRTKLNATSAAMNGWWGVVHDPVAEAYVPLDLATFGQARIDEATTAMRCLASGLTGTLTPRWPRLRCHRRRGHRCVVRRARCFMIIACHGSNVPGSPRPPCQRAALTETTATGQATATPGKDSNKRAMWRDHPAQFGHRSGFKTPANVGKCRSARAINACRAYGAWAPPHRYAIGHHSTFGMFAQVLAGPKCLFHA